MKMFIRIKFKFLWNWYECQCWFKITHHNIIGLEYLLSDRDKISPRAKIIMDTVFHFGPFKIRLDVA